jgi:hypothetical protein
MRVRRSAADLEKIAVRVLAHVKSNAGHRLEQIGKALKVETAVLKRPVANLLAGKKLRTKGQKRGTMYFAGGGGGGVRETKASRSGEASSEGKGPWAASGEAGEEGVEERAARRAAPRSVKRAPAQTKKAARKPSRKPRSHLLVW